MALDEDLEKMLVSNDRKELAEILLDPKKDIQGATLIWRYSEGWHASSRGMENQDLIYILESLKHDLLTEEQRTITTETLDEEDV